VETCANCEAPTLGTLPDMNGGSFPWCGDSLCTEAIGFMLKASNLERQSKDSVRRYNVWEEWKELA